MKQFLRFACIFSIIISASASPTQNDPFSHWYPPGPDDERSPCPMMNSLANHGFINHNGKNITRAQLDSLTTYIGFGSDFTDNITFGNLDDLGIPRTSPFDLSVLNGANSHGRDENDASLSRQDFYFGNNFAFNQSIFDESKSYWTKSVIDLQLAANSRLGRIATSKRTNPTYNATTVASGTPTEQALYLATIGNVTAGTARRDWVIYWFENERLPTKLGWTTRPIISLPQMLDLEARVNATGSSNSSTST